MDVQQEQDRSEHQPAAKSFLLRCLAPIVFAGLAAACFPADVAMSRAVSHPPRWLSEFLENAEVFGNGYGVALIVGAILVLDRSRRAAAWHSGVAAICGGLGANVLKLLVSRVRPRELDPQVIDSWLTLGGWRWISGHPRMYYSFPSAHTATAFAFAWALSLQYPSGKVYFFALAAMVGWQRVATAAHFPSDVLAGAAVGALAGIFATEFLTFDRSQLASSQHDCLRQSE